MDTLPCSGRTALWFSHYEDELREAERICLTECPVLKACDERAQALRPSGGVWGGRRYQITRTALTRRRRGRPPKAESVAHWTPERDAELVALRQRGMTWGQITVAMNRSEDTCRARYQLLTRVAASTG